MTLNMEHFIGISFWIAPFFICLQARNLHREDAAIFLMQRRVTCPQDSKFYAPPIVKVECIAAAMDCVMRELDGTVTQECSDPGEHVFKAVDFFQLKIEEKGPPPTTSTGCECEKWPQTPFNEFLERVKSLLEFDESCSMTN